MNKILLLLLALMLTGCAFKSIDSCGAEGNGAGCTPVATNLDNAVAKSERRVSGQSPDITVNADYTGIDREMLADEYKRIAPGQNTPKPVETREVKVRIYPYSDGERFYDVRDIYILVQKSGWSRGAYVHTDAGTISLKEQAHVLPAKLYVTSHELNLRDGANALFKSLNVVRYGQELVPEKYRDGWYYVNSKQGSGWVHSTYVSEKRPPSIYEMNDSR